MDESDYLPYDNMNLAKGLQLEIQASFFFSLFCENKKKVTIIPRITILSYGSVLKLNTS